MHKVKAKTLLSNSNGMNIYRGCLHGCIYCDSRSICYNMNHDFEDIEVKENALELLETKLKSKRNKCMIGTGSMSDPYIPIEKDLRLTRKALELIDRYDYGLAILTKSALILRDLDLLISINNKTKCVVQMTLTTIDDDLCKIIEPNVSLTSQRIKALETFRDNGIDTFVWLCPILPFINDNLDNIKGILDACIKCKVKGIICFGFGLTLREGNREYYYQKLDEYFPGLKEKYIKTYGNSYAVNSTHNKELMDYFIKTCKENNIMYKPDDCFAYMREFKEKKEQLSLF